MSILKTKCVFYDIVQNISLLLLMEDLKVRVCLMQSYDK